MGLFRLVRAWLLAGVFSSLLLGTVTAKDGRDFAGFYGFTDVQEQGDMVHLTLHLRIFNYSDADIKGAAVTLQEGSTGMALRGTFPMVKVWQKNKDVQLSQEFTVPRREYEDWNHPPAQPNVLIIYQDAKGHTWQKGVQMSPRPIL